MTASAFTQFPMFSAAVTADISLAAGLHMQTGGLPSFI
jgi:hypothetical protein